MKILRSFGDSNFKTMADGRRVFFPYGLFSKGRIVDSEETYERLVSHQVWSMVFGLVTMPFVKVEFGWLGLLAYFFAWALWVEFQTRCRNHD